MKLQISEPKTPEQREAVRRILSRRNIWRSGTDPSIFCHVYPSDDLAKLMLDLEAIPGIKVQAFDLSPEAPIRP